jgi:hypothetical protein
MPALKDGKYHAARGTGVRTLNTTQFSNESSFGALQKALSGGNLVFGQESAKGR